MTDLAVGQIPDTHEVFPVGSAGRHQLRAEVEHAHRTGNPLAVILVDIVGFRDLTEEYGAEYGDQVLAATGLALRTCLRSNDMIMRYDGHEFVCAMPGGSCATATTSIDRARRVLSVTMPDVAISAAHAVIRPGDTLDDLLHRADAVLRRQRASVRGDLSSAGRYIPAGPHGEPVAGDFFDTFELDPSRLVVALGDVAGHGPGAMEQMTQLRAATREFAREESDPVEVLRRLDRMQAGYDAEDIATLWLGMYDPQTGLLRYASAGHLPPVVVGVTGRPTLLKEAIAPPLGTGVVVDFGSADEIHLPVGAVLVAYSDGLVERPGSDLEDQLEALRELVGRTYDQSPAETTEGLVDSILDELVPDAAAARDDVCVLVLRREARACC